MYRILCGFIGICGLTIPMEGWAQHLPGHFGDPVLIEVEDWISAIRIGSTSSGELLVTWDDVENLKGRRLDVDRKIQGEIFNLPSLPLALLPLPDSCLLPKGLVAAWASEGTLGSDEDQSIQYRLFDDKDIPLNTENQANTFIAGSQAYPAVHCHNDGFKITWTDTRLDQVMFRSFDAQGQPEHVETAISETTGSILFGSSVATARNGTSLVVWTGRDVTGGDLNVSIQGRLIGTNGVPVSSQFQVNTYTTGSQQEPSVAATPNGDFLVVWKSQGSLGTDQDGFSVQAKLIRSGGNLGGSEFQINQMEKFSQGVPFAAVGSEGLSLVVWENTHSDLEQIVGRFLREDDPAGPEFVIADADALAHPHITADGRGNFAVAWAERLGFVRDWLFIQIFRGSEANIFIDGFESGNLDLWSSSTSTNQEGDGG